MQNGFIESFNGRFRDECLNLNRLNSLHDAREIISRWKDEYNMVRPEVSLGDMTPVEYAITLKNHAATKVARWYIKRGQVRSFYLLNNSNLSLSIWILSFQVKYFILSDFG